MQGAAASLSVSSLNTFGSRATAMFSAGLLPSSRHPQVGAAAKIRGEMLTPLLEVV
jgi:hypothetical protein